MTSLMLGCASTPVAVAPVGPNPNGALSSTAEGQLEVYSALIPHTEGNNPTWYQHADYRIYDQRGKLVAHVDNTLGHYARSPRPVSLPPGNYIVRAAAEDYLSVKVPVVIAPGRVTRVHLDDAWRPVNVRRTELVSLPAGNPVGWSPAAK